MILNNKKKNVLFYFNRKRLLNLTIKKEFNNYNIYTIPINTILESIYDIGIETTRNKQFLCSKMILEKTLEVTSGIEMNEEINYIALTISAYICKNFPDLNEWLIKKLKEKYKNKFNITEIINVEISTIEINLISKIILKEFLIYFNSTF